MKKIAIVIPTYQRIKKLERLLDSLAKQTYQNFSVYIYCDNKDKKTFDWVEDEWINFGFTSKEGRLVPLESCVKKAVLNDKQEFVTGSWNKFFKDYHDKYDAVQWLCDDTEVFPNFLEEAVKCMETNYPDTDGVIGTHQICPNHPEYTFKYYGQPLIGKKFISRYEAVDYAVCCTSFRFLFQDEELYLHATSLGKFKECNTAILKHFHPGFIKEELDSTHSLSRTNEIRQADKLTYTLRRSKGLIWGLSFQK